MPEITVPPGPRLSVERGKPNLSYMNISLTPNVWSAHNQVWCRPKDLRRKSLDAVTNCIDPVEAHVSFYSFIQHNIVGSREAVHVVQRS